MRAWRRTVENGHLAGIWFCVACFLMLTQFHVIAPSLEHALIFAFVFGLLWWLMGPAARPHSKCPNEESLLVWYEAAKQCNSNISVIAPIGISIDGGAVQHVVLTSEETINELVAAAGASVGDEL